MNGAHDTRKCLEAVADRGAVSSRRARMPRLGSPRPPSRPPGTRPFAPQNTSAGCPSQKPWDRSVQGKRKFELFALCATNPSAGRRALEVRAVLVLITFIQHPHHDDPAIKSPKIVTPKLLYRRLLFSNTRNGDDRLGVTSINQPSHRIKQVRRLCNDLLRVRNRLLFHMLRKPVKIT